MTNEEQLLKALNPDLFRIWEAMKVITTGCGNGSVEIHFVRKRIRVHDGVYIKPSFEDETIISSDIETNS